MEDNSIFDQDSKHIRQISNLLIMVAEARKDITKLKDISLIYNKEKQLFTVHKELICSITFCFVLLFF